MVDRSKQKEMKMLYAVTMLFENGHSIQAQKSELSVVNKKPICGRFSQKS